jgi:SPP1 family predicted phage head-tail adaptor
MAKRGAGMLRNKVEIWREASTGFDSLGQTTSAPTLVYRTYANIKPLRGVEGEYARQLTGTETHAITIRHTTFYGNVTRKNWVEFDGRRFEVVAVNNIEGRDRMVELVCGEDV